MSETTTYSNNMDALAESGSKTSGFSDGTGTTLQQINKIDEKAQESYGDENKVLFIKFFATALLMGLAILSFIALAGPFGIALGIAGVICAGGSAISTFHSYKNSRNKGKILDLARKNLDSYISHNDKLLTAKDNLSVYDISNRTKVMRAMSDGVRISTLTDIKSCLSKQALKEGLENIKDIARTKSELKRNNLIGRDGRLISMDNINSFLDNDIANNLLNQH